MKNYQEEHFASKILVKGDAFVVPRFEPKDTITKDYVEILLGLLNLHSKRRTNTEKYVRCISDVLVATNQSPSGLICWPMDTGALLRAAYGRDIAVQVYNALSVGKRISEIQKSQRGSSKVYQIDKSLYKPGLSFREHGIGPVIVVREEKPKAYWSPNPPKGKTIPLKHFGEAWKPLEEQVKTINQVLLQHPLEAPDDRSWVVCKRIFNDGRLDRGGRLYGDWQNEKSHDRLQFSIDGEAVAEIDIKGSHLFLCHTRIGHPKPLPDDPYEAVRFVSEFPALRPLAKRLVSAMLCKEGEVTRFPRGDKKDKYGNIISIRDHFNLPKNAKVGEYVRQIYTAFPFLKEVQINSGELMFLESSVIVETLLSLAQRDKPIPAYPIHDCLLCKRSDEDEVVSVLKAVMVSHFGREPTLDVEYSDQDTKIIRASNKYVVENQVSMPVPDLDDDYPVVEDY